MLLYESDDLNFGKEIIDVVDNNNLTPLYLLCEEGLRKSQNFNEEEEILYYEIVERQKMEKKKGQTFKKSASISPISLKKPVGNHME